jgi:dienelactone hydrolase
MLKASGWSAALILVALAPNPDVKTRELEYRAGETVLHGFVAWDDAAPGKRPGVLVIHEWWGLNEHARNQARRLARAGYVGFALDMYGEGKHATDAAGAQALVQAAMKDPAEMVARFQAALDQLKQDPHVDPERVAVLGYCFGGTVALVMAQSGVDLDAVVTFHGGLANARPPEPKPVQARILILTGADDPFVPGEQVTTFVDQLKAAGASIDVVSYPGARHSFTNPDAGARGMEQLAYNAEADRRSWQAMLALLNEVWPAGH